MDASTDANSHENNSQAVSKYAGTAAACALLLALVKLILFWTTGSLVIAFSAWDSCTDVMVSLLNRKVIRFARQDADEEHPYGHGKAECIANLGQSVLIMSGVVYIFSAVIREFLGLNASLPEFVPSWDLPLFFIAAALASWFVSWLLMRGSKKYRSPGLMGDAVHYQSDVWTNLINAIALATMIVFKIKWLDPIFAIIAAVILGKSALKLVISSINELMDRNMDADTRDKVTKMVMQAYPVTLDIHKFRGRKSGHRYLIDFHITLPKTLTFLEVHTMADELESMLVREFCADVTIHTDPG